MLRFTCAVDEMLDMDRTEYGLVVRRPHFSDCKDAVCRMAGEIQSKYMTANRKILDDDLLFKQTNDLAIAMKKHLRQRHDVVCLKELALLCDDLLWFSAGTPRLFKKLVQMLVIVEKLDTSEIVYRVLLEAWEKLNKHLNTSQQTADGINSTRSRVCSEKSLSCKVHSIEDNDFQQFAVWSTLLDMTSSAQRIVKPYTEMLACFVSSLITNEQLESDMNQIKEDRIYAMTKLLMQSCQLIGNIGEYWKAKEMQLWIYEATESLSLNAHFEDPSSINDSFSLLRTIAASVKILHCESLRKDCRLLAGSLISYLLSTDSDAAEVVSLSILMLCILSRPTTDSDAVLLRTRVDNLTFGQLFFIHGLFAYVDARIFVRPSLCLPFFIDCCAANRQTDTNIKCSSGHPGSQEQFPSAGDKDVDLQTELNKSCPKQPFLLRLFDVICRFCLWPREKFHAFRLLELWYKQMAKITSCSDDTLALEWSDLLKPDSKIVKQTLDILLAHLDNSVDGISDHISSVIVMLIRLKPAKHEDVSLGAWLLEQALCMPWYVRARYFLMVAILEHLTLEKLSENCHWIVKDICQCLSTNYLTPSAVQVFQCILKIFSKQPNGLDLWMSYCWPQVLQCLSSENCLMARNASQHVLGITMKAIPSTVTAMLAQIESDSTVHRLYAHLAILSVAKRCDFQIDLPMKCLKQALQSKNNDLRLLAFDLTCISPRTTDPLKHYEVEILKAYLPLNMNIDSAPFRKQLQANLHSALIRARDSSLSRLRQSMKRGQRDTEEIILAIEFLDWLWNLCMLSLQPGGSFQRIQTALSWTRTVLDTFILRPDQTARKGIVPDDISLLTSTATELGRCQFLSPLATQCLMSCLFNEIDEISEMAADILLVYFPWPLILHVPQMRSGREVFFTPGDLMTAALRLCHSSRVRDCESGAVLLSLIFERSIIANRDRYKIEDSQCVATDSGMHEPIIEFLSLLLDHVEIGIDMASRKPLEAAMSNPIQGVLCAVRRCLGGKSVCMEPRDAWFVILRRMVNQVSSLARIILNVFGGRLTSDEMVPSFEQISQAIEDAIGESLANQNLESSCEDAILSPEHQLMNTWCWLNIKEGCLLLGQLVAAVLKPGKLVSDNLLAEDDVKEIGETFLHILTSCRHRGAIEGACLGFSQFCSALLRSSDSRMNRIPCYLLQKIISRVDDLSASSVTRRSAGLPLILQTILANEAKVKKTTLLHWTVDVLLNIMSKPLDTFTDDQHDVPQVHAVNIITAIVRESSMANNMSLYLDRLTVEALKSFNSPVWAMRNASMQLFGYLLCKLVGEKKVVSDDLQTKTITEFVSHFPDLSRFMASVIRTNVKHIEDGRLICDPTLVPVLSILARLTVGLDVDIGSWFMRDVTEPVVALSKHWLYAVRQLSARALTALVPRNTRNRFIMNLLECLPPSRSEVRGFNELHGQLLQLNSLLDLKSERCCNLADVTRILLSRSWILSSEISCLLVRSEFLRLMTSVFKVAQETSDFSVEFSIRKEVEMKIGDYVSTDLSLQRLGSALWTESFISASLLISMDCSLVNRVVTYLTSDNLDIRSACLAQLTEISAEKFSFVDAEIIQTHLWKILIENQPWKVICDILVVLLTFNRNFGGLVISDITETAYEMLMNFATEQSDSSLAALALEVSAFIVRQWISETVQNRTNCYLQWTAMICNCCKPKRPSDIRYRASRALEIAASGILNFACNDVEYKWSGTISRLLLTIILLLNDEDADTRDIACEIVASLAPQPQESSEPLHFNQAFEVFLRNTVVSWCLKVEFVCNFYHVLIDDDFAEKLLEELNNRHRRWELFPTEDANPFLELEFLSCRVVSVMKELPFPINPEHVDWLLQEADKLKLNTEKIILALTTFESDILLVRANRKLSAGLMLLISLSDLLAKWSVDVINCHSSFMTSSSVTSSTKLNQCKIDLDCVHQQLGSFLGNLEKSTKVTDDNNYVLTLAGSTHAAG